MPTMNKPWDRGLQGTLKHFTYKRKSKSFSRFTAFAQWCSHLLYFLSFSFSTAILSTSLNGISFIYRHEQTACHWLGQGREKLVFSPFLPLPSTFYSLSHPCFPPDSCRAAGLLKCLILHYTSPSHVIPT